MRSSDPREVLGAILVGAGLAIAYFSLPSLHSPWLWLGLAVAVFGVILMVKSRPGVRGRYAPDEAWSDADVSPPRRLPGNESDDCTP